MPLPANPAAPDGALDTPWVESEALETRLDALHADPELRAFAHTLRETGVAEITLDPEALARIDQAVAAAEPHFADGALRVQDLWRRSAAVRALALDPKVLRFLDAAYGRRAFPFQTLNFRTGSEQSAHADAIHFHSVPERFMCGVWFALEDVEPGAGPLVYHPGSHKGSVLGMAESGVVGRAPRMADYNSHYEPALQARLANIPPKRALLKKGQALVWAANLAHGGAPIETPGSTRRSLVVHYFFEGCLYFTPRLSEPEQGRYQVRLPPNIRRGGWAWPRLHGARVPVPPRLVLEALSQRLRRRVHRLGAG